MRMPKKDYSDEVIIVSMFLLGIGIPVGLFLTDTDPFEEFDKVECYKLQKQAEEYKNFMYSETNPGGFYITEDDKEMCDFYRIIINAPVK
jgi:hypothetical protein